MLAQKSLSYKVYCRWFLSLVLYKKKNFHFSYLFDYVCFIHSLAIFCHLM